MERIVILLLAAGASSRMRGADKLLQDIGGIPVLRRQALAALATGVPVIVALSPDRPLRDATLQDLDVVRLTVAEAADGMSASIRSGIAAVDDDTGGVLILPADMPEITTQDLAEVLAVFQRDASRVVRATGQDGTPGHPVIFPARLFPGLLALRGDQGARSLVQADDVVHVPLPSRHALTDLDTPEDWAAWRAAQPG